MDKATRTAHGWTITLQDGKDTLVFRLPYEDAEKLNKLYPPDRDRILAPLGLTDTFAERMLARKFLAYDPSLPSINKWLGTDWLLRKNAMLTTPVRLSPRGIRAVEALQAAILDLV